MVMMIVVVIAMAINATLLVSAASPMSASSSASACWASIAQYEHGRGHRRWPAQFGTAGVG